MPSFGKYEVFLSHILIKLGINFSCCNIILSVIFIRRIIMKNIYYKSILYDIYLRT